MPGNPENLLGSTAPVNADVTDGVNITLGTIIVPSADGIITHIRWRAPNTGPAITPQVALYQLTSDISGTLLSGPKNWPGLVAGQYNQIALDAPVAVTAGTRYVAVVYTDRYVATNNFFTGAFSNGQHLTGPADGASGFHNGKFHEPATGPTFPDSTFQASCYFVDVVYQIGDTIIVDTPSTARAQTPLTTTSPTPVTIQDSPGMAQAVAPSTSAPVSSISDDTVMPVLNKVLSCFATEAARTASPPKYVRLSVGSTFIAGFDQSQGDECCEGTIWVRLVDTYPTDGAFPSEEQIANTYLKPPGYLALVVELGALRCSPFTGPNGKGFPVASQWLAAAQAQMDDYAAMRRAYCCLRTQVLDVVTGHYTPLSAEANCAGGTLHLTIKVPFCECP